MSNQVVMDKNDRTVNCFEDKLFNSELYSKTSVKTPSKTIEIPEIFKLVNSLYDIKDSDAKDNQYNDNKLKRILPKDVFDNISSISDECNGIKEIIRYYINRYTKEDMHNSTQIRSIAHHTERIVYHNHMYIKAEMKLYNKISFDSLLHDLDKIFIRAVLAKTPHYPAVTINDMSDKLHYITTYHHKQFIGNERSREVLASNIICNVVATTARYSKQVKQYSKDRSSIPTISQYIQHTCNDLDKYEYKELFENIKTTQAYKIAKDKKRNIKDRDNLQEFVSSKNTDLWRAIAQFQLICLCEMFEAMFNVLQDAVIVEQIPIEVMGKKSVSKFVVTVDEDIFCDYLTKYNNVIMETSLSSCN